MAGQKSQNTPRASAARSRGGHTVAENDDLLDEQQALKQKLARRMAFTAAIIALLLGALALFDQLSTPQTVTVTKKAEPLPSTAIKPDDAAGAKPQEAAKSEESKTEEGKTVVAEPEGSAVPVDKKTKGPAPEVLTVPKEEPPAKTEMASKTPPAVKPAVPVLTKPLPTPPAAPSTPVVLPKPAAVTNTVIPGASSNTTSNATPSRPITVLPNPASSPTPPQAPTPPTSTLASPPPATTAAAPSTSRPATATPATATAARPASAVAPAAPQPRPQPNPPRLFSGFQVQAGVFTSTSRAEEMYAKLQAAGIPATIESRVAAGPFNSREEADAAREKMKALGIDTVLILPKGQKR